MKRLHKRIIAWSVVVCLTLLVIPLPQMPNIPFLDKVEHFLLFAYITYVFSRAVPFWVAAFFAVLIGLATEFIQCALSWRDGSIEDFLANLAGVVAAYIVLKLFSHYKE